MENLHRSWMFVPAHIQKMIDKSLGLSAHAVMLDIEDGVLPPAKPQARELIRKHLQGAAEAIGPAVFVRMNAPGTDDARQDIQAAVWPGLEGLVVPKISDPEQVRELEPEVAALERERGIRTPIRFMVAIEDARGLLRAESIARSSERNCGLLFGAEDYARDLGLPVLRDREARELIYARSMIINAAAAAQIQSVDGVWPDLQDTQGLQRDAAQARNLGFTGKSLIHPSQIDAVNHAFQPSSKDIEFARQVINAFKEGEERGLGAVAFGGQLLDRPIVDRAFAVLRAVDPTQSA